jgi:tRNA dimethylallyltransferase
VLPLAAQCYWGCRPAVRLTEGAGTSDVTGVPAGGLGLGLELVFIVVVIFIIEVVFVVVVLVIEVEHFVLVLVLVVVVEFVFLARRVEVIGVRHGSPKDPGGFTCFSGHVTWEGHTLRCHTDAMLRPVIAVVGPTAAGKSELSLALARTLGGEVVNADSMQLYQGMNIGTAKLTLPERAGIAHHLLDIWPVTQAASVSEYQQLARQAIDDIRGRGKTPIVVGGSGLYVRAAIDNLQFPRTDPAVRARLEGDLGQAGSAAMHARLAAVDPVAAAAILPGNGRRVVRALEVIELSGQPFSATLPEYESVYPVVQVGVVMPRPDLDQRIAERVRRMWALGLVDEVGRLELAGLRDGRTASRALGYAQVLKVLAGEWTEEVAAEQTILATRRFVRRQESWFRRDPRVNWIPAGPDLLARALAFVS